MCHSCNNSWQRISDATNNSIWHELDRSESYWKLIFVLFAHYQIVHIACKFLIGSLWDINFTNLLFWRIYFAQRLLIKFNDLFIYIYLFMQNLTKNLRLYPRLKNKTTTPHPSQESYIRNAKNGYTECLTQEFPDPRYILVSSWPKSRGHEAKSDSRA